jgi:hypothetical protein
MRLIWNRWGQALCLPLFSKKSYRANSFLLRRPMREEL